MQMLFRECDYPKIIVFLLGLQAMFFFYLFGRFYIRSYYPSKSAVTANGSNKLEGKLENDNNMNNLQNGATKTKTSWDLRRKSQMCCDTNKICIYLLLTLVIYKGTNENKPMLVIFVRFIDLWKWGEEQNIRSSIEQNSAID